MNFQEYCNNVDEGQKITAEETFVLVYTNTKDEAFSISPESIKLFLVFIRDNYDSVLKRWSAIPSRKDNFFQYEEKSYREIFKSADTEELKTISSAGRSQTKALTKLVSKVVAFLSGSTYSEPEENTFLTQEQIQRALAAWDNLFDKELLNRVSKKSPLDIQKRFRAWIIASGLSERTANSYAGSGIKFCDKYLRDIGIKNTSLYELSAEQILISLELLKNVPEWQAADKSGNAMYSAAGKKLAEFLSSDQPRDLLLSKPFLLLAGISGTGKTRFVREQAKATGAFNDTYCLSSVRPDWHEPSDLLGYISRLSSANGGQAEYITTDVLQFIAKAWRAMLEAGLTIEAQDIDQQGERLVVTGARDVLNAVLPYWLCLDEMNLAPVEQYFADYLSVLETREWRWNGDAFTYLCDPLLKPATIEQVADGGQLRVSLGFANTEYDDVWALFCKHGLGIPFNLIVAGTVNMDETTHGFSRKVIDRALSFDFGDFFPNDFDQFFTSHIKNKTLSYPLWSQARLEDLSATFDADGQKTITFLAAVNEVLDNTPFKLAYRALNELLLAVISQHPQDELTLKAVWDDFLMCKVLPRIDGDSDKLGSAPSLLEKLTELLTLQLAEFWDKPEGAADARPDLYREKKVSEDKHIRIGCRSKAKLEWMQTRLVNAGFTSFWP